MSSLITVTGAAGRLGQTLCRELRAQNMEVLGIDRQPCPQASWPMIQADLTNPRDLAGPMKGTGVVVHLANFPGEDPGRSMARFLENVSINTHVFDAAQKAGAKKIVFASSIQVVGGDRTLSQLAQPSLLPYLPLDSQTPACLRNGYALSKYLGEQMLRYFADRFQISGIAMRLPWLVDSDGLKNLRQDRPTKPVSWMPLDQAFSFLTYADAARLIARIIQTDLPGMRTYLPAANRPYLDLPLPQIVRTYFPTVPLRQPVDQLQGLVDTGQIQQETGWSPQDLLFYPDPPCPACSHPAGPPAKPVA
ncbi:MAG: NAD(P)-dependent oxidoreductase [Phycisphaeraceae bacterium]|nr:NAD(P)-dependent oxidoreductase [Phycisphaeraceae bacterium]